MLEKMTLPDFLCWFLKSQTKTWIINYLVKKELGEQQIEWIEMARRVGVEIVE